MATYILRRLVAAIPTLLGISLVVFLLVRLLPGDPARTIAGVLASAEDVERIRLQLGLDQPLPVQYAVFLGNLVQLDLGTSARTSQPVIVEVMTRLPSTVQLAVSSIAVATVLGVVGGVLAATNHNKTLDHVISTIVLIGVSMPVYWLALMLIVVFAINLQWLPAAGSQEPGAWVLPTLALAAVSVGLFARMTRSAMLEILRTDFVRTARAKGLADAVVVYQHALRNALLPVVTVVGLQFGSLLGGAVLTETVFGWPGLGQLLVESIFSRDYALVQGIVLTLATMFILVNLTVDILYAYIDPRIHYG